ncbi:MAG: GDSL-type esterase/lipase family protein [Melioribacteraceae bacterium]
MKRLYFLIISLLIASISLAQVKQIRVACVGNSITHGGGGTTAYPYQLGLLLGSHYEVKNFGVSGTTLLKKGDVPYWKEISLQNAKDYDPHIVIIKLGTNDSKPQNWVYKNEYYQDYVALIKEFRMNGRNPQIYVARPCPSFIVLAGINGTIIREEILPLADSVRKATNTHMMDFYTPFVDKSNLFPDGVHPSTEGYKQMGQIAATTILNSPSGVIRYFNSMQATFEKGKSVTLFWETTAGSQATINGNSVKEIDSLVVFPTQTTTYKLITKGAFPDTAQVTVTYFPPGKVKSFVPKPSMIEKNSTETSTISWTTSEGSAVTLDGISVDVSGSKIVSPKVTTTYELAAKGDITETSKVTVQVLDADKINRSLNGGVKASSVVRSYVPANVIDGDPATFWKSGSEVSPWIYIDLLKTMEVSRVVLNWGNIYAKSYFLQSISEAGTMKNIYSTTTGDGGIDDVTGLSGSARYVRVLCTVRSIADSGYVLNEFEVYGKVNATDLAKENQLPFEYKLEQNYPNPFNPVTNISYSISSPSKVTLKVFDVLGNEVSTLVNEFKQPGLYSSQFSILNSKLSSGVYFYRLQAGNFTQTKKLILLK